MFISYEKDKVRQWGMWSSGKRRLLHPAHSFQQMMMPLWALQRGWITWCALWCHVMVLAPTALPTHSLALILAALLRKKDSLCVYMSFFPLDPWDLCLQLQIGLQSYFRPALQRMLDPIREASKIAPLRGQWEQVLLYRPTNTLRRISTDIKSPLGCELPIFKTYKNGSSSK